MLYHLIEGRLPDDEHWTDYTIEKFDATKGEPHLVSEMAAEISRISKRSNDEMWYLLNMKDDDWSLNEDLRAYTPRLR